MDLYCAIDQRTNCNYHNLDEITTHNMLLYNSRNKKTGKSRVSNIEARCVTIVDVEKQYVLEILSVCVLAVAIRHVKQMFW